MDFLEATEVVEEDDENNEELSGTSRTAPIPLSKGSRTSPSFPTQSAPSDYIRLLSDSFQAIGIASVPSSSSGWNFRRGNQVLQYRRPGRILEITLPMQEPGPYEVIVQVTYAGVSYYDLKIVSDAFPFVSKIVPGGEVTGKVVNVGKNVTHISLGDWVVIDPEYTVLTGETLKLQSFQERKILGITHNGGWAQYVSATGVQIHKIPVELSGPWAVLVCELACIVHGWKKIQPVSEANRILVLRNGISGTLWGMYLRLKNFDVEVCDCNASQLGSTEDLGLSIVDFESLASGSGNTMLGYDVIVDTTGDCRLMDTAFEWLNPMGTFLLYGLPSGSSHTSRWCVRDILDKEITVCASISHSSQGFAEAVHAARKLSKYSLESLGVALYSISDYQNALSDLKNGRCTKLIFTVQDPSKRSFLSSPSSPLLSPYDPPKSRVPSLYL